MVTVKPSKRFRIEKLEDRIAPSGWGWGWGHCHSFGRPSFVFNINTNITNNISVTNTLLSTVNISVANTVNIRTW
jgi:hypothetical protein